MRKVTDKISWRFLPICAGAGLLIAYGVAEGWWISRWNDTGELERAVSRLHDLPITLGSWSGQRLELTERELAIGQISAYSYRRYVHMNTGKALTVLLMCGRPGPISAHSPEICFTGAGYKEVTPAVRRHVCSRNNEISGDFWSADFRKDGAAIPDPLRVTWSWNAAGNWVAVDSPRFSFARYPVLFKIYVVQHLDRLDEPNATETCDQFIRMLLPVLPVGESL